MPAAEHKPSRLRYNAFCQPWKFRSCWPELYISQSRIYEHAAAFTHYEPRLSILAVDIFNAACQLA